MEDTLDALLFGHDLPPADRSSIQERLNEDPDLATAWAHWCAVRRRFRTRLPERISDRRLLVLYVLEQRGATETLTTREQAVLDECRDDIARAIDAIPALEQVVEHIREEQADFEEVWATHVDEDDEVLSGRAESGGTSASSSSPDRTDRARGPQAS